MNSLLFLILLTISVLYSYKGLNIPAKVSFILYKISVEPSSNSFFINNPKRQISPLILVKVLIEVRVFKFYSTINFFNPYFDFK